MKNIFEKDAWISWSIKIHTNILEQSSKLHEIWLVYHYRSYEYLTSVKNLRLLKKKENIFLSYAKRVFLKCI